jgi:hypothetical protein
MDNHEIKTRNEGETTGSWELHRYYGFNFEPIDRSRVEGIGFDDGWKLLIILSGTVVIVELL